MAKLTTSLLKRAASLAAQSAAIQSKLSEAFVDRYGVTYSDVDCDELIDILDYGGGEISLAIADRAMSESGHPPRSIAPEAST